MRGRILSQNEIKWAYERHCEGYTFQEVADALYVNVSTIRDEFKRNGLKKKLPDLSYNPEEEVPCVISFQKKTNAKLTAHQINWAYHYHWKNYTLTELASLLGVPRPTLGDALRRYNLKIRYHIIQRKPLTYPYFKRRDNNVR